MELLKKLRVNTALPLYVVDAPHDIDGILPGIALYGLRPRQEPVAQLILFAADSIALSNTLARLLKYISHDTLFWICYPKKTGAIRSDLIRMDTWEVVSRLGFRGQTSVSVNEDWTGIRFTNAPRSKPSQANLPPEERLVEGIDFVNRTTTLPPDAIAVLSNYKGLAAFFDTMSFSHKKEHIVAIVEAKKPGTRARRIEKMAAMLLKMQDEKAQKAAAKSKKA